MNNSYDIVVIGGGPAGYVSAIRGAQLGAKVCLIEKKWLGGTCLNEGCIPTKALYRSAEIINTLKNVEQFGVDLEGFRINIRKMQERKQAVIDTLASGIDKLMETNRIHVIYGTARFRNEKTVDVKTEDGSLTEITGTNIIIASGSKPSVPEIEGADLEGIYTSDEILNFENLPLSLAVIGGGVIGMEFACIFNALGAKVTVMEYLPSILSSVDSDLIKRLMPMLKRKGMDINISTKVTKIEKAENGYRISAQGKKGDFTVESEKVLLAIGRNPSVNGLNLNTIGIQYDRKGIKTDENYETNIKGIYAAGDVNGRIMLAHAASFQGEKAAEKIMGYTSFHNNREPVPGCIFIFPEIAYVGLTEDEAKKNALNYSVGKFMFGANGKALTLGEAEGLVKVIAEERDEKKILSGVHIMGPHASDLIHEAALAVWNEMDIESIVNLVHAHPTLSEAFHEACSSILDRSIHIAPVKKNKD
jgi:dihydrolipoamide dehydrogenase